ncbi:Uncharacterised protein [Salmonella enterica subsp. enterica]|uniref:Uncharacterized protein n=1 Tax=Salmonella enterica I TaxID=59201 RepID=A0A379VU87_SALET|nr:Uncharacterised protein [Salmonella enterica subsp. enterica]
MTTPFTHETLPADPKAAIRQMKQARTRANRRRTGGVRPFERHHSSPGGGN